MATNQHLSYPLKASLLTEIDPGTIADHTPQIHHTRFNDGTVRISKEFLARALRLSSTYPTLEEQLRAYSESPDGLRLVEHTELSIQQQVVAATTNSGLIAVKHLAQIMSLEEDDVFSMKAHSELTGTALDMHTEHGMVMMEPGQFGNLYSWHRPYDPILSWTDNLPIDPQDR